MNAIRLAIFAALLAGSATMVQARGHGGGGGGHGGWSGGGHGGWGGGGHGRWGGGGHGGWGGGHGGWGYGHGGHGHDPDTAAQAHEHVSHEHSGQDMPDMTGREWAAILPMIVLMIWMGVAPQTYHPSIGASNAAMLSTTKGSREQQVKTTTDITAQETAHAK